MSECADCGAHAEEARKLAVAAVVLRLNAAKLWHNVTLAELAKVVGATEADLIEARRRIRKGEL